MTVIGDKARYSEVTIPTKAEEAEKMNKVYADFAENFMAMPVVQGVKTPSERFAGAIRHRRRFAWAQLHRREQLLAWNDDGGRDGGERLALGERRVERPGHVVEVGLVTDGAEGAADAGRRRAHGAPRGSAD